MKLNRGCSGIECDGGSSSLIQYYIHANNDWE